MDNLACFLDLLTLAPKILKKPDFRMPLDAGARASEYGDEENAYFTPFSFCEYIGFCELHRHYRRAICRMRRVIAVPLVRL